MLKVFGKMATISNKPLINVEKMAPVNINFLIVFIMNFWLDTCC
jgi:hypothetical protein